MRAEYYAIKTDMREKYIIRIDNAYICNYNNCNTVLSVGKKPTNIIRHFYFYHRDIYHEFIK